MVWLLIPAAFFGLILHRLAEGLICNGGDVPKKKFFFDMGSAGVFLAVVAAAWILVMPNPSYRLEYGFGLLILTPFIVLATLVFCYLSFLAYERREFESLEEPVEGQVSHGS